MKRYDLGATDLKQYAELTEEEREAWLHPEAKSYHSFHVERMGQNTYRWRDSREAKFYVGTLQDLSAALLNLQLRKLDPEYRQKSTAINVLSQEEIDDLFKDL